MESEKRKVTDLDKLKRFSGPFTKLEEVDEFVSRVEIPDNEKQDRLNTEVRLCQVQASDS